MFTIFDFPLKQWFPGLINSSSANMQPELRPTLGCPAYKDGETGPWQGLGDSCVPMHADRCHWSPGCLLWLVCSPGAHPSLALWVASVHPPESLCDCTVFFSLIEGNLKVTQPCFFST